MTTSAKTISVIETKARHGNGTEGDAYRTVTRYWSPDGALLAEKDPQEELSLSALVSAAAKLEDVLGSDSMIAVGTIESLRAEVREAVRFFRE